MNDDDDDEVLCVRAHAGVMVKDMQSAREGAPACGARIFLSATPPPTKIPPRTAGALPAVIFFYKACQPVVRARSAAPYTQRARARPHKKGFGGLDVDLAR